MRIPTALKRSAPPVSPKAAQFLEDYEQRIRPFIFASAIVPLFVTASTSHVLAPIVDVASWVVFLIDYIVQSRTRVHYLNSRRGLFDFSIVVLTSPWYLIPGVHGGAVVALLRVVRLARLVVVARGAQLLLARLGRAALIAALALVFFSLVALEAEKPVNPEFGNLGDALWWGYVTLTTVGYGDIVPVTVTGRFAGVGIMTLGIALLGVLAGSLASFFRITPKEEEEEEEQEDEAKTREYGSTDPDDAKIDLTVLHQEVHALRTQITHLSHQLDQLDQQDGPDQGSKP